MSDGPQIRIGRTWAVRELLVVGAVAALLGLTLGTNVVGGSEIGPPPCTVELVPPAGQRYLRALEVRFLDREGGTQREFVRFAPNDLRRKGVDLDPGFYRVRISAPRRGTLRETPRSVREVAIEIDPDSASEPILIRDPGPPNGDGVGPKTP